MPWADAELLPRDELQDAMRLSLLERHPLLVGKIGANELQLLYWSERLNLPGRSFPRRHVHFWNLRTCASNAGLKPRTRSSYRQFAALLRDAAIAADHLGVWQEPAEHALYRQLGLKAEYHTLYYLCPWFADPACAWSHALVGKTVFVVSPFLESIRRQYQKRELIWQSRPGLLPKINIVGYRFPFLISEQYTQSWQDVYQEVTEMMRTTPFDIALLGCGALGLPLGMEAKRMGRQAIHMGGFFRCCSAFTAAAFAATPFIPSCSMTTGLLPVSKKPHLKREALRKGVTGKSIVF